MFAHALFAVSRVEVCDRGNYLYFLSTQGINNDNFFCYHSGRDVKVFVCRTLLLTSLIALISHCE